MSATAAKRLFWVGAVFCAACSSQAPTGSQPTRRSDPIWTSGNHAHIDRLGQTTVTLPGGNILVSGGIGGPQMNEVYDWASHTWSTVAPRTVAVHSAAVVLPSGWVLFTGGGPNLPEATVELYDPKANTWLLGSPMITPRKRHSAWLLPTGKVLVLGDTELGCELFDPDAGTWSPASSPSDRLYQSVQLSDGRVLAIRANPLLDGGFAAEIYDPWLDQWARTTTPTIPREGHITLTAMAKGQALLVGQSLTAERFDADAGTWLPTKPMLRTHSFHAAAHLADGTVLVTGGVGLEPDGLTRNSSAELYDPRLNAWSNVGPTLGPHSDHASHLLPNDKVLIAGGVYGAPELFTPTCSSHAACRPNQYCGSGSLCVPQRGIGEPCTAAVSCDSGFCVNDRCCSSACAGPCEGCAEPGSVGACTVFAPGSASADTAVCYPFMCAGNSSCPTVCATDVECFAGMRCIAGACVATARDAGVKPDAGLLVDAGTSANTPRGQCGCSAFPGGTAMLALIALRRRGSLRQRCRRPSTSLGELFG